MMAEKCVSGIHLKVFTEIRGKFLVISQEFRPLGEMVHQE